MSLKSLKDKSGSDDDHLFLHEVLVDKATEKESLETTTDLENMIVYFRSDKGEFFRDGLSRLTAAFRERGERAKRLVVRPLTPEPEPPEPLTRERDTDDDSKSYADDFSAPPVHNQAAPTAKPAKKVVESTPPVVIKIGALSATIPEWFHRIPRPKSFDPHKRTYLIWLSVVSTFFLYNALVIPYRSAFIELHARSWFYWLFADYVGDLVYLADIIICKPCIRVHFNGIEVSEHKEITRSYVLTQTFLLDVLSIIPLDLFYLIPSVRMIPLFRALKLLKILTYWELLDRIDRLLTSPYYFRVLRSVAYMMYLIHVNACVFYFYSYLYDFDPEDGFVYNNKHPRCQNIDKSTGQPVGDTDMKTKCNNPGTYSDYMFCFFFSVSMITIIGNLNFPGTIPAMVYSAVLWFLGVFVFATLVGQIRDVLKAMTRQEDEFGEVMDALLDHMQTLKIPKDLRDRIRTWLLYNWEQQRTTDEGKLLDGLPARLRSALAMEVHSSIIDKVQLFKGLEKFVLEELLLRLKPSVFLPNDYICKRGEIGKEMYIIKSGNLEVLLPDGRVAVTLSPGSVFGEISLLALAGGNRRTADVKSKGFSNLYVLSKSDLTDVLKDYPETFDALKLKAHELLHRSKPASDRPATPPPIEIIRERPPTPQMVHLVYQVMQCHTGNQSHTAKHHPHHKTATDYGENELLDVKRPSVSSPIANNRRLSAPVPVSDVTADIVLDHTATTTTPTHQTDRNSASQLTRRRSSMSLQSGRHHIVSPGNVESKVSEASTSEESIHSSNKNVSKEETSSLVNLRRRLFSSPKINPISSSTPSLRSSMVTTPITNSSSSTISDQSSTSEFLSHLIHGAH